MGQEALKGSSVRQWCDDNEPSAKFTGISTAFRSGAKARAAGKSKAECRYGREDFASAWEAGFDGMDAYLSAGGILLCDHCGQVLKGAS
jgi:ribosome modulation factor